MSAEDARDAGIVRRIARRAGSTVIGFQRWDEILFLHWPVAAEDLRGRVDPALELELFDGRAYVSLTPFTVRGARLRGTPRIPLLSEFHEVNLRTYVHPAAGGAPGVWFFSLDAARAPAAALARAGLGLPYRAARIERSRQGSVHRYMSVRTGAPQRATLSTSFRAGEAAAAKGALEAFLIERYALYSRWGPLLLRVRVRHRPWELRSAEVDVLEETLSAAGGIPRPTGSPIAHYSDGVDVEFFPPELVR
jgi:uncharacterized protein YqjF (DUF2071 family)